jgi:hypothetical protein
MFFCGRMGWQATQVPISNGQNLSHVLMRTEGFLVGITTRWLLAQAHLAVDDLQAALACDSADVACRTQTSSLCVHNP